MSSTSPVMQLDGISRDIFMQRYAMPEETEWSELALRNAKHIAAVEINGLVSEWQETFYNVIAAGDFIPGGRILSGAGRRQSNMLNCLHKNTRIFTNRGWRRITDVNIGDKVLTHRGRFREVTDKFNQGKIEKLYSFNINGLNNSLNLQVTGDHKIMTPNGYRSASDLKEGDLISTGFLEDKTFESVSSFNVSDFTDEDYEVNNGYIFIPCKRSGEYNYLTKKIIPEFKGNKVKNTIDVNVDFARWSGYYLAEGCSPKEGTTISFTFNSNETKFAEEILVLGKKMFDIDGKIDFAEEGNWLQVIFNSSILNKLHAALFGTKSWNKRVPTLLFGSSREIKLNVLACLARGDGTPRYSKYGLSYDIVCANPDMIYDAYLMAKSLGYDCSYSINDYKKEPQHHETASLAIRHFTINNELINLIEGHEYDNQISFISSIDVVLYNDVVWDISVEEDQSLVAEGVIVSNCFRLHPQDTVESIGKTIQDTYRISCGGGGIGFNFSDIRPKGDDIQNIRWSAPGAVSVMRMFNEIGHHVKSGKNRRTAFIAVLNVDHPDLFNFLHVKLDLDELTNFNISVGITNEFLNAVRRNKTWGFKFNGRQYHAYDVARISKKKTTQVRIFALNEEDALGRAQNHYRVTQNDEFGKITKVDVMARDIWDILIENAWKSGEPGIYNIDLANSFTNVSYFENLASPNPCQPASATVMTPNGIRTISDIHIGDSIWSGQNWTNVINKVSTGENHVYDYHTRAGSFVGTEGHRVVVHGKKMHVRDVDEIDTAQCRVSRVFSHVDTQSIVDGLVLGDGTVHKASNNLVLLCVGKNDHDYFGSQYHGDSIAKMIGKHREALKSCAYEVKTTITSEELPLTYKRSIPDRFRYASPNMVACFLRGLYSANGSVVDNRVTLKASSFAVIRQTQEMLSSLGIRSYYTTNKPSRVQFSNGEYECRKSYDLNITTDRNLFAELIGFIQDYKTDKLREAVSRTGQGHAKTTYEIVSQQLISQEETFDITVDDPNHTYWTGGLLVSNCGEVNLPKYGSCCLGHINLDNMFNVKTSDVDWPKFARTIRIAIRFLDNVLTSNHYPISECKNVSEISRRIGLGVTGLHHLLLRLGYVYGDEKCLEFLDRFFATFRNEAYKASVLLAKEKGAFSAFDAEKFAKEDFFKQLPPRIQNSIKKYGIRNAVMLSVAPCGTNSMVLGVSSGIEPIFAPVYQRQFREGNILRKEYIADSLFAEYFRLGKNMDHFRGAYDISVDQHIAVQATIQKYIDSAISKTINLPHDYPVEDLADVVLEYASYVKGFTIYREGSKGDEPLKPIDISDPAKLAKAMSQAGIGVDTAEVCRSGTCEV